MKPDALAGRLENLLGSSPSSSAKEFPSKPPPPIPDHEIIARIGGGSYGEVWLARSVTGTLRAVKVVWRCRFSSERPYEREFHGIVQFEPISRSHPGVVNVLHVGRDDAAGCFFYVMELADSAGWPVESKNELRVERPVGDAPIHSQLSTQTLLNYSPRTLASDLHARGRMPVLDVVTLGVQLANALGHLHRHGLVHRDVKPSNVIFVDGQPKLADIGLVAGMDEAHSFVGTEGFIPPEGPGSEQADVFSLGRLLYEAATGKDRCEFPMLPADLDQWPRPEREAMLELNEVLARACAANPKERHANAAELAGDLNVILAGRSVRRAYGIERRLRRATQVSAAALAVVALAGGVVWFQRLQQHQAETRAAQERVLRERAEAAELEAQRQLYTALLEQARTTVQSRELGQSVLALDALQRAAAISNTVELRREAFAALALPDLRLEREITFVKDDGRMCDSTFQRYAVCMQSGGPVEIHATSDNRLLASLPAMTNAVGWVKLWSQNGEYLAIKRDVDGGSGTRADLEVWNLVSTQRVLHERDCVTERALSFHPSLPQLATSRIDGDIRIWDLETGQRIRQFRLPATEIHILGFAPDGDQIAFAYDQADSHLITILDGTTGAVQATITCPEIVIGLAWQPHGRWIAAPDFAGNVRLIDPKTGEVRALGQHKAQAVDVDFSPDGLFLISRGWERELICWDMGTLQRAFTIGLNSNQAQFSSDGRKCAIHMADRLQIYTFQKPSACRELPEDLGRVVLQGAFSPDGRWFSTSGDQFIGVWDLAQGGPAAMIRPAATPFFSPTTPELYAYAPDVLARWHVAPAANGGPPEVAKLPIFVPPGVQRVSVRSNELISTCSSSVCLMPLGNTNAQNVRQLAKPYGSGEVSPNGRWLAIKYGRSVWLSVYQLPEVERVAVLTNRADICNFAFSPRNDEVAVVTRQGLEFYDTTRWQRTRELPIQCAGFGSVRFMPDGESFWLTSDRRNSTLRSTRTFEVLLPLPAGTTALAVSPDGRHLAVSVDLRRVQLWDMSEVQKQFRQVGVDWTDH
jgi:serine/threonine protein kinase/WD40 repeat protein